MKDDKNTGKDKMIKKQLTYSLVGAIVFGMIGNITMVFIDISRGETDAGQSYMIASFFTAIIGAIIGRVILAAKTRTKAKEIKDDSNTSKM